MSRGNRLYRRLAVLGLASGAVFTALPALPAAAVARTTTDTCGTAPNTTFEDEGSNSAEINSAADCAAAFDVLEGKDADGDNNPEIGGSDTLTRSQTASLAVRLAAKAGFALPAAPPNAFDDDDNLAAPIHLEVNQAAAADFIEGKNVNNAGGTNAAANVFPDFFPNDPVTRGQMVAIIVRMAEKVAPDQTPNAGSHTFPDVPADHPFGTFIGIADDLGIIQGGADGRFNPEANISRGQAITIFSRVIDFLVESGKIPALGSSNAGVVTACGAGTYTFTNGAGLSIVVTHDATNDTFSVDATAATRDVFDANCTVGDEVTFINDPNPAAADADQHQLRNISPANRRTGLVGNVNTAGTDFAIVDGTTGVVIGGPFDYAGDILQIDGAGVAQGTFDGAINEGDTIVGTLANGVETWNLTNQTRTGTATGVTPGGGDQVSFGIGNLGDEPQNANDALYLAGDGAAGTETFTIGGTSATAAQFKAALNNGDTVAYSRTGGIETFALTNVAPAAQTGTLNDGGSQAIDTGNDELVISNGAVDIPVDYTGSTSFSVNGTLVTETEFETALTAGDSVTFTPDNPDTPANEQKIALTNANLTGQIDDISTAADEYDVVNPEGNVIFDDLDYTAAIFGGSDRYFVNGSAPANERSLAQFEAFLDDVDAETTPNATDTITVIDNGNLSTDHQLTTDEDGTL